MNTFASLFGEFDAEVINITDINNDSLSGAPATCFDSSTNNFPGQVMQPPCFRPPVEFGIGSGFPQTPGIFNHSASGDDVSTDSAFASSLVTNNTFQQYDYTTTTTNTSGGASCDWQHQQKHAGLSEFGEATSSKPEDDEPPEEDLLKEKWYLTLKSAGVRIKGRTKNELLQVAEKIRKRRRESAARSRARKATKLSTLSDENESLRKENEILRRKLNELNGAEAAW
eukprot:scaffold337068_cov32-Prasinocladus_malaysianus.AAC.1